MAAITGRWEPSYSRQLLALGLEPLGPRRVKLCRTFAQRTAQNSRHMDLFTPTGTRSRHGKQSKTYRETLSRTETHFKSPLPYLTRLLNGVYLSYLCHNFNVPYCSSRIMACHCYFGFTNSTVGIRFTCEYFILMTLIKTDIYNRPSTN